MKQNKQKDEKDKDKDETKQIKMQDKMSRKMSQDKHLESLMRICGRSACSTQMGHWPSSKVQRSSLSILKIKATHGVQILCVN